MEKSEKVAYWIDRAMYDLKTAEAMFRTSRYVYSVFMCQQAIEKAIKACYIPQFNNEAPRTHNLTYLISLISFDPGEKYGELCAELTSYYIESRYPDYKQMVSKMVNKKKTHNLLAETKGLFKCLKKLIEK